MSKGAYAPSDHYQAPSSMTGYIYDGMGNRIAKGPISTLSCNVLTNGFSLNDKYVYGLDGKQLLQTSGWFYVLHSNFYANGQLLATNDGSNWYYNLNDWVGTKRVIANTDGSISSEWASLPYGDGQTRVNYWGTDDTENHFTGKMRDTETGLDYFGARYYTSNAGRWMLPDWSAVPEAVPYADLGNPQTLNLYTYVGNNPINGIDADGHYSYSGNGQPCGWYGFTGGGLASTMTAAQVPCSAPNNSSYSADNGEGQEWANDTAEASTQGLAQQTYGRQPNGSYKADPAKVQAAIDNKTPIGNGQCVAACLHLSGVTPHTASWTPGKSVLDLNDTTDVGLAIASFGPNGKFIQPGGDQNSAIYMGHDPNTGQIMVVDQWPPPNAKQYNAPFEHPLLNHGVGHNLQTNRMENNAYYYHVIVVP